MWRVISRLAVLLVFILAMVPVSARTYTISAYSHRGKTALGTRTRHGICAGPWKYLGRYVRIGGKRYACPREACQGLTAYLGFYNERACTRRWTIGRRRRSTSALRHLPGRMGSRCYCQPPNRVVEYSIREGVVWVGVAGAHTFTPRTVAERNPPKNREGSLSKNGVHHILFVAV